jgi:hypothetical protein
VVVGGAVLGLRMSMHGTELLRQAGARLEVEGEWAADPSR